MSDFYNFCYGGKVSGSGGMTLIRAAPACKHTNLIFLSTVLNCVRVEGGAEGVPGVPEGILEGVIPHPQPVILTYKGIQILTNFKGGEG